MAQQLVSLPDDLKAKMDQATAKAKEHGVPVNWSRVAQAAFEREVERLDMGANYGLHASMMHTISTPSEAPECRCSNFHRWPLEVAFCIS